jgi:hypothetical protein
VLPREHGAGFRHDLVLMENVGWDGGPDTEQPGARRCDPRPCLH